MTWMCRLFGDILAGLNRVKKTVICKGFRGNPTYFGARLLDPPFTPEGDSCMLYKEKNDQTKNTPKRLFKNSH